ncbi:MAG: hypothetical protein KAQ67_07950 [Gammaproteobacteria bacterium]|nr:hypothetical protein [Gammaproteobacteria bacterium]
MGILAVQNSAVMGIQQGLNNLRRNAAEIASADQLNQAGSETDLAGSLVGLKQSEVQVQANAKVVSAVDEVLGTLLDTEA